MNSPNEKRREDVALFRFGLIADLVHMPRGSKEIAIKFRERAARTHVVPHSQRCRIAAETFRHWLKLYRNGGFDALKPLGRRDSGVSHALPKEVADLLCQIKDENHKLSVQLIIKHAQATGNIPEGLPLPPSTVHRLLSRAGLMKRDQSPHKDHRRFEHEHANELWMSDVMHGPTVAVGGKTRRKAYLIAFIDDATRIVPFAAFALAESTAAFLPQLKQAIMRRGIPKRLFVDNGSAYRSHHLQLVCAKLGTTLIHARPYHPQAKGKQERWFRTVRLQLLPTLTAQDTSSLSALNQRLWGWIEGEYHRAAHRGLGGMTPLDAWASRATHVDHVGARPDIESMFLFEQKRKVARDRTVSLDGIAYEVDAMLVNTTITLRYDPQRRGASVQVWGPHGHRHDDAKPVDVHSNCWVKRATYALVEDPKTPTLRLSDFEGARQTEVR
jgi:putative transposase